ncbi:MAG: nucleotidyltransferase domain-containing protein [Pseudomonadota bacterium]
MPWPGQDRSSVSARVFWLDRPEILQRLRAAAGTLQQRHPEIERIVLFGSLARGDAVPGSDADLLLVLRDSERTFLERTGGYRVADIGVGVDVFAYTCQELAEMLGSGNAFVAQALREGVVLWEKEEDEMVPREAFIELALRRARPGSGSAPGFRARRTWSLPVSDLRMIIRRTSFVVVGGVATRLYMPERMTLDVDILISGQDVGALYQELKSAGCRYEGPLSAGGSHWTLADGAGLDVIESDAVWVPTALATARQAPDGLPVIDLPYLVLMKLEASRTQDLADVSRMLGGAAETELDAVRQVVGTYLPDAVEDLESLIALGRMEEQGG